MMAETDIIKKALDVLVLLNTAIKNVRMYPPTSATVSNAVEKLHRSLLDLLLHEESVIFAEAEKAMLICGKPLSQKDQERPHTASLLNTLLSFELKSISFIQGLSQEELTHFIALISRKPESIQNEGGLGKLIADQNIMHVCLDQKVYVSVDKDHQIISGMDIKDEQISRFFMVTHPDMDPNSPQFREVVKNPDALSQAFKAGLEKIMAHKETLTSIQLSDNLNNMLSLLDKISGGLDDGNRSILSRHVGQTLLAADQEIAQQLTTQNMEHLLGGFLLKYLMAELTQNNPDVPGKGGDKETRKEADDSKDKLLQVAEKFSMRLQDTRTLMDEGLMTVLPKIIEQLIVQKEQEVMENMMERLAANLTSGNPDVRLSAARSLADIIEQLPIERKNEIVEKFSGKLIEWIKSDNLFSPEYQRICVILKNATQEHIGQKRFPEALKYLDAFNAVACNIIDKPDAAKNASLEIIDQLSVPENIDILLNENISPEAPDKDCIGLLIAALGHTAIDDLLDQLRASTNSDERVKIMHLITAAKDKSLPLVMSQITKEAPWFYLRNIAYLLGQIGNEKSARELAPLLSNGNDKLRQEALKSIYKTGGDQRAKILLAALPLVDEEFKSGIVEVLGQSKATEAVYNLIDLLRNRPLVASAARTNLEEKICAALGTIGSADAIPALSEVAEMKSFLGLRAYPDKVKAAAARSLITLRRIVAESG